MWRKIGILAAASTLGAVSAAGSATTASSWSKIPAGGGSLPLFMYDTGAPAGSYGGPSAPPR